MLSGLSAPRNTFVAQWVPVSQGTARPQDRRYPVSAADTLRAFEQYELAYEKAADTESLVFANFPTSR